MHDTFLEKYCIRCINPQNETTQTHFDRQNMRDKVILFLLHSQISTRNIFLFLVFCYDEQLLRTCRQIYG